MSQGHENDVFEMIIQPENGDNLDFCATKSDQSPQEDWHEDHQEGQLAVDVLQDNKEIIVVSTMAGAVTNKIEVFVHNDLLTIRGVRKNPIDKNSNLKYFHTECYWGSFSRSIVLPVEVKGDLARAEYKNGILIIRIPKSHSNSRIPITIVEE